VLGIRLIISVIFGTPLDEGVSFVRVRVAQVHLPPKKIKEPADVLQALALDLSAETTPYSTRSPI